MTIPHRIATVAPAAQLDVKRMFAANVAVEAPPLLSGDARLRVVAAPEDLAVAAGLAF